MLEMNDNRLDKVVDGDPKRARSVSEGSPLLPKHFQ